MSTEKNCSLNLTATCSVILASLNGVSGLLTIIGNSIILLALYKTPFLKKTTSNYFVGSLACADLSVGLFANALYVALSGFVSLQEIQELKTMLRQQFLICAENSSRKSWRRHLARL